MMMIILFLFVCLCETMTRTQTLFFFIVCVCETMKRTEPSPSLSFPTVQDSRPILSPAELELMLAASHTPTEVLDIIIQSLRLNKLYRMKMREIFTLLPPRRMVLNNPNDPHTPPVTLWLFNIYNMKMGYSKPSAQDPLPKFYGDVTDLTCWSPYIKMFSVPEVYQATAYSICQSIPYDQRDWVEQAMQSHIVLALSAAHTQEPVRDGVGYSSRREGQTVTYWYFPCCNFAFTTNDL